jgi:hypothetical protein
MGNRLPAGRHESLHSTAWLISIGSRADRAVEHGPNPDSGSASMKNTLSTSPPHAVPGERRPPIAEVVVMREPVARRSSLVGEILHGRPQRRT